MELIVVGLNHRSAPVELRERLAVQPDQLPEVLGRLRRDVGLDEAAVLSTCNRVEIYGGVASWDGAADRLRGFLGAHGGVSADLLADRLYTYRAMDSLRHLFAVASGLDSMVLGEAEILHQVKAAYEQARRLGATGRLLNVVFQKALSAAKAVRTQTGVGSGSVSIGTVAVELAGKIFGDLRRARVLLIGAGEIGELTLRRLMDRGVSDIRLMNRSVERAVILVGAPQARPFGPEQLAIELEAADIVISSTSATAPLLGVAEVSRAMPRRHRRPLCLVDLGVPRNVDPAVGALENVYRFDIDDLEGLLARHARERQETVAVATALLEQRLGHLVERLQREDAACVPSSWEPAAAP